VGDGKGWRQVAYNQGLEVSRMLDNGSWDASMRYSANGNIELRKHVEALDTITFNDNAYFKEFADLNGDLPRIYFSDSNSAPDDDGKQFYIGQNNNALTFTRILGDDSSDNLLQLPSTPGAGVLFLLIPTCNSDPVNPSDLIRKSYADATYMAKAVGSITLQSATPSLFFNDTEVVGIDGQEFLFYQAEDTIRMQYMDAGGSWVTHTVIMPTQYSFLVSPRWDGTPTDNYDLVNKMYLDNLTLQPDWGDIQNKPSTYPPNLSTNDVVGGVTTRLEGDTLYIRNDGNPA
jgi:hypothetical protein